MIPLLFFCLQECKEFLQKGRLQIVQMTQRAAQNDPLVFRRFRWPGQIVYDADIPPLMVVVGFEPNRLFT